MMQRSPACRPEPEMSNPEPLLPATEATNEIDMSGGLPAVGEVAGQQSDDLVDIGLRLGRVLVHGRRDRGSQLLEELHQRGIQRGRRGSALCCRELKLARLLQDGVAV